MATPPRHTPATYTNATTSHSNPFRQVETNAQLNGPSNPFKQPPPRPKPPPPAADSPLAKDRAQFQFQWETPVPKQPVQDSPDVPLPPFQVGMSIDSDRIKLLDFVGQGSFAHVYLGYDYSTSSKVAVKCLMKAGADPKKMAMQRREVMAMEDLNGHPNVIRLIRTVDTPEWLLIVMEFCQMDLYEAIMQKGGFPDIAVKDVFGQLCDGVLHCHSRGYYHRDLKPENILLDVNSLIAKITDFGLATRDTWSYEMGCGSTRYIPPEACATADHTKGYSPASSDVWALGILLINLLFSKNPWFEATMADPIFSIYVTDRPDILRHHFKISAEFDSILSRVFHVDPSKRIPLPEFKRLVNALPTFLEDEENVAPAPMAAETQQVESLQSEVPSRSQQKPQERQFSSQNTGQQKFPSQNNPFGSSKMQGPLVVFGSIPDPKYTQFKDPKNPFNSGSRGSPMNITSSDYYNPFTSGNPFASQPENLQFDQLIQPPTNPFFSIPTESSISIAPITPQQSLAQQTAPIPAAAAAPFASSPFTTPPSAAPNSSQTTVTGGATLIWTAPARVAAPELPNTLTLGREGIGRLGISRLATAKQRLSKRGGIPFGSAAHHHHHHHHPNAGGAAGTNGQTGAVDDHHYLQQRPAFGLAFLGTAIAGYVNQESDDEVLEGEEYDSDDLEADDFSGSGDIAAARAPGLNRSAPDEESHYEVVKVDRRLIPDLEKGIKRAVNRGMKKFRPFMHLGAGAAPTGVGPGGSVQLGSNSTGSPAGIGAPGVGGSLVDASSTASIRLGKGVAGGVSKQEWDGFGNEVGSMVDGVSTMPGAFVFAANDREKKNSAPLLPQTVGGSTATSSLLPGSTSNVAATLSENLNMPQELPLYYKNDSRSVLRPGNSVEDLWRGKPDAESSDDDERAGLSRMPSISEKRSATETTGFSSGLAKMYNGLAGMSILGGRSKSLKRVSERKSKATLHDNSSILPAPQAPFAFIAAKNAKSRVSERDFEALVVNAKTNGQAGHSSGSVLTKHRHRVRSKTNLEDASSSSQLHKSAPQLSSVEVREDVSPIQQQAAFNVLPKSPDTATSNQLEYGRSSPNQLSLNRPMTASSLSRPSSTADGRLSIPISTGGYSPSESSYSQEATASIAVNPFRTLNTNHNNNPFQRPASYNANSNPFSALPSSLDAQQQQQQRQQQLMQQPARYSMPAGMDVNPYLAYGVPPSPSREQQQPSPFFEMQQSRPQYSQQPLFPNQQHHSNQQQQQQQLNQPHQQFQHPPSQSHPVLHQKSMPLMFGRTAAIPTYADRGVSPNIVQDQEEAEAVSGTGSNEETVESDDEIVNRRGEDRYVRGFVRGFGWLVGGSNGNHVERSGSQGV
ncbi:hypothetical protein CcCBS67573_g00970 [Chytriomyces confervae]|uniref:Protein kinase domain-containing protein n=1 Tax=Chytriomyces confervae TaxID=246404 RepID=A0A507FQH8_9FUNG|nr:hypothetical protein CcCBS67573_g00970 [Chytriomyces confervae]